MRLPPWMWKVLRSRKTRIALACAPFAFCLLVLLFYFGTSWWGRSLAERQLHEFELAGFVVDPEKYWFPAANPEDDLFQDPLFQQELRDPALNRLVPGNTKASSRARRLPGAESRLARMTDLARWVNPPAPDDRTAAEQLLKEHHAAMERLEALRPVLSLSKQAVWPVKTSPDPTKLTNVVEPMMKLKRAAEAAGEIAVLHLATGDTDKAAGAVQAMLDVIRLELDPKPTPVSVIIADTVFQKVQRVIWEGVMRGGWSDGQLQALDQSLAALRPQQAAVTSHLGEIALLRSQTKWFLTTTRALPEIDIDLPRTWDPTEIWEKTKMTARQFRSPGLELAKGVKWQREFLDGTARSGGAPRERFTPQDLAEFRRIAGASEMDSLNFMGGASQLSFLALSTLRMETTIAITRAGIALERYRLRTGKGAYPNSLEALVPDFLPEVPMDPIGSRQLQYRLQADGSPQLWSVGGNFTDDGGLPHSDFTEGDLIWITRPIPGFTERDLRR